MLEAELLPPEPQSPSAKSPNHATNAPSIEQGHCDSPISESQLGSHANEQEPLPCIDAGSVSYEYKKFFDYADASAYSKESSGLRDGTPPLNIPYSTETKLP